MKNQPTPEQENFALDLARRDVQAAVRYLDLVTSDEYLTKQYQQPVKKPKNR